MESSPHSSALDGLITVTVKKAVNHLRPSATHISVQDNVHNRALILAGYLAIVQDADAAPHVPTSPDTEADETADAPEAEAHVEFGDDTYADEEE